VWIDTHCHLDAREFDADRDRVVAAARGAGVGQLVLPAVAPSNFDAVRGLAHRHGLAYALGIHPMCVDGEPDGALDALASALAAHRDDPRLVAVGEIGLDGFVPCRDPARQRRFLDAQLALAREHGLPVLLHVRKAIDPVLAAVRRAAPPGGIAHAFNGSEQQADAAVAAGLKLGFGGAFTHARALKIRRLAAHAPADAIVLETDAPDIPPEWLYRTAADRAAGAAMRNASAELPAIGRALAALRGVDAGELERATTANALACLPRLAGLLPHAVPA
jgi:TatD DNase family protein